MLAVVGGVTVVTLAVFYGTGWIVTANVDGTVSVDNPSTAERNVDSQIRAAWNDVAGYVLGGVPLVWLLMGVLLHAGSWLAGGDQGVRSLVRGRRVERRDPAVRPRTRSRDRRASTPRVRRKVSTLTSFVQVR